MTTFAPRPCSSCPYRRDVPSGVWHEQEYAKLPAYDLDTMSQPGGLFMCHNHSDNLCTGWVGCHGDQLLALRLAVISGTMTGEEYGKACDYVSPVPLFDSGFEAAEHGRAEIDKPSDEAEKAIRKVMRTRGRS